MPEGITMKKLTALSLGSLKTEGYHRDRECVGLYVQVRPKTSGEGVVRSWLYRYKSPITRKGRWMGLGSCDVIGIHEARDLARAARRLVTLGADPIDYRNAKTEADRQAALQHEASRMTFRMCCDQSVPGMVAKSRNEKHAKQFRESLDRACEAFGDVAVSAIDSQMVIKFLTPIWEKTPETASRIRNRVERVLDWAKAKKFREGDNPAAWKGNLEHALFAKPKGENHHEAMSHKDVPAFMVELRKQSKIADRALELLILTATRTGEVRFAKWSEFDLEGRLWTVPGERMKAGKPHTVPLSDQAITLLQSLPRDSEYVFASRGGVINEKALNIALNALTNNGYTVHGFRSTFRDWAGDATTFDSETVEHALAHEVGSKVAQAYRRGSGLEKRKLLMQAWASFCSGDTASAKIVRLHA
jgi:integrase